MAARGRGRGGGKNLEARRGGLINLRIVVMTNNDPNILPQTKTLRFDQEMLVKDCLAQLRDKIDHEDPTNLFGLYKPFDHETGRKAMWLTPFRSLQFYDFTNGTLIEYKSKMITIRVNFVDGATKNIVCDESLPVLELCATVADKIGLLNASEFSLRQATENSDKNPLWLNENQTLAEQGINPLETEVEYAKKYFFEDNYIGEDDPIQLHLLLFESNKAILGGRYPIRREEAVTLGSIRAYIIYGEYDSTKHLPGFYDMNELIPPVYQKDWKKIEKEIASAHRSLGNTMTLEKAKVRYVTTVRKLDCYGTNYFAVKERNEKGRLRKMYLGITKDKITFRNEEQVDFQYFLIEHLARWAPHGSTLTLDFGAYAKHYFFFETEEADTIAGIIGGYIDLIHKRNQEAHRIGEGVEDLIAEEESIVHDITTATYGQIGSYVPGYVSVGNGLQSMQSGAQFAQYGTAGTKHNINIQNLGGQYGMGGNMPKSHSINVVDMGSALKCTRLLSQELGSAKGKWRTNSDVPSEEWNVRVGNHFNNLSAKVGNLLGQVRANPGGITLNELDLQAKEITLEAIDLTDAVRYLVSADDEMSHLLDGAKAIADTISDMMELLLRVVDDPTSLRLMSELEMAEKSIAAANLLFQSTNRDDYIDKSAERLLVQCVDDLGNAMDSLLARVGIVGQMADESARALIEEEADKVDGMKDWVLSNIGNLTPALLNLDIMREINLAANSLGNATGAIMDRTLPYADVENTNSLNGAANRVNTAIKNLLLATTTAEQRGVDGNLDLLTPTGIMLSGLDTINKNISTPEMIVSGVKVSANAHKQVLATTKTLVSRSDSLTSERLLKGAQALSSAMRDLITSARVLSKSPEDNNLQLNTTDITHKIDSIAQGLLDNAGAMTALNNLRYASKATATSILKLATTAHTVENGLDSGIREGLLSTADEATLKVAELLKALGRACKDPQNFVIQSELLEAARKQIPIFSVLSSQSKIGAKSIKDPNQKQDLNICATNAAKNLKLLMASVSIVSDIGGQTEIEEALQDFDAVQIDLDQALYAAKRGLLTPIQGQSRENSIELLNLAAKTLGTAVDSLVGTAQVGGKIPNYVSESAKGMSQVASAVRAMASTIADRDHQVRLIEAAKGLSGRTLEVIDDSRILAIDPKNLAKIAVADNTKSKFENQLSTLVANAYGLDASELNDAIDMILVEKEFLNEPAITDISYQEASEALHAASQSLSFALTQLTQTASTNPTNIGPIARLIGGTTREILQAAAISAGAAPDGTTMNSLLDAARSLADSMRDLLGKTKLASIKRTKNNISKMDKSSKVVSVNIDQLISSLGNATSAEAEESISEIMEYLTMLEMGELEALPLSKDQILEEFQSSAQALASVSASIVSASHVSAKKLGMYSLESAAAIKNLLVTAQSAILSSEGGIVLSSSTANILKDIDTILKNPRATKEVLTMSKKIIADGLKLISDAKEQAKDEKNPENKKNIVQNAQLLVNAVTRLAQATRLAAAKRPDGLQTLVSCCKSVKSLTQDLEGAMRATKVQTTEIEVDPKLAQKLLGVSRAIAVSTTGLIRSSSTVSANPSNQRANDDLNSDTKTVQTNIQDLVLLLGSLNPGIQECEASLEVLNAASSKLNSLTISATVGSLDHVPGNLAQLQENCATIAKQLSSDVKSLVIGAQTSNKELFNAAKTFQASIPQLVQIIQQTSEATTAQGEQTELLGHTKNFVDSVTDLFNSVKALNVRDKESVSTMAKAAKISGDCVGTLLGKLQSVTSLLDDLDNTIVQVENSVGSLGSQYSSKPRSFEVVRGEATDYAKQIASAISRLQSVDKRNLGQIGLISSQLGNISTQLVEATKEAIAATEEKQAQTEMLHSIEQIGHVNLQILELMKGFAQGNELSGELSKLANQGNSHIGSFLNAAKKGAVGEMMMDRAAEEISEGINKLNQCSMFAQAGQLDSPEAMSKTVTEVESELENLANQYATAVTKLAKNSTGSGKEVGQKALDASGILTRLVQSIQEVSSKISDSLGQQDVLSAGKLLSITSQQLILASRDVQKLPEDTGAAKTLVASQNAVGDAVSRLVSVVQDSAAEAARGERELEAAKMKLHDLISGDWGTINNISGEKIIDIARENLKSLSDLVFAGNQEESIRAAQNSLNLMANLLSGINSASLNLTDNPELASLLREAAANLADSLCSLFSACRLNRDDPNTQEIVEEASANVSQMMNDLINVLRRFPGLSHLKLEEDDIESLAEMELLKCANLIAEAASSLLEIKPPKGGNLISQDGINAAIMDAAKSIANATGFLIEKAVVCQRERKEVNLSLGEKYQNDPTWANGLISAAQSVAAAVQQLVKACNSAVAGEAEEEALVATARAVAAATAHLVSASKAKADPNAPSQRNLSKAAQAVAMTTATLVKAAQAASEFAEEDSDDDELNTFSVAGGIRKQMEQQNKILSLEKMLEDERKRMLSQRKAKYANARSKN